MVEGYIHPARAVAFIGSPGAGKSTLVNALTDGGASTGKSPSAVTKCVQSYEKFGLKIYDCPGQGDLKITTK